MFIKLDVLASLGILHQQVVVGGVVGLPLPGFGVEAHVLAVRVSVHYPALLVNVGLVTLLVVPRVLLGEGVHHYNMAMLVVSGLSALLVGLHPVAVPIVVGAQLSPVLAHTLLHPVAPAIVLPAI